MIEQRAFLDSLPQSAQGLSPRAFFELMKPRVMSLVVFTGLAGLLLAPQQPSFLVAVAALFAMSLGAGACGALNMWHERHIDARMSRTKNRPLPQGRVLPTHALLFGLALAAVSLLLMALAANLLAALLLAITIAFYILVYTVWLKPRSPQNIVIGGAAGALPPLIGWAAATGSLHPTPLALFLIIFLWTPPHFWALAILRRDDYANANIPMLPVVASLKTTARQIILYVVLLFPAALLPLLTAGAGPLYAAAALLLGAEFLRRAARLYRADKNTAAKEAGALFFFSILYLFLIFAALLADAFLL